MNRCMSVVAALAVLALGGCTSGTDASELAVSGAKVRPGPDGHVLEASVRYRFGRSVREAMRHGVPITLEVETRLLQPRRFLWPDVVFEERRLFRLDYHALSGQYLLEDLQTGRQSSFPSYLALQEALDGAPGLRVARYTRLPAGKVQARVRARLHIASLPAPLRLTAYFSPDWHLASDWYTWPLQG